MTDAVIAKLNKAAIDAGMTDEAGAKWVSANAPLYSINAEGKARRTDKPDLSPKKSLRALRETTPDAFDGDGAPAARATDNPFAAGPSAKAQTARVEFILQHGAAAASKAALLANCDIAGRPLRRRA